MVVREAFVRPVSERGSFIRPLGNESGCMSTPSLAQGANRARISLGLYVNRSIHMAAVP